MDQDEEENSHHIIVDLVARARAAMAMRKRHGIVSTSSTAVDDQ